MQLTLFFFHFFYSISISPCTLIITLKLSSSLSSLKLSSLSSPSPRRPILPTPPIHASAQSSDQTHAISLFSLLWLSLFVCFFFFFKCIFIWVWWLWWWWLILAMVVVVDDFDSGFVDFGCGDRWWWGCDFDCSCGFFLFFFLSLYVVLWLPK